MVVAIVWSILILTEQTNQDSRYDFLSEEQVESIKELESMCSNFSAAQKVICLDRIENEIFKFQEGASDKAIKLKDVTICHSVPSDIECLLKVAQKSNNQDACNSIIDSHEKFESTDEDTLEYLKGVKEYCLHRVT